MMAYGNYFPATYQPQQFTPQPFNPQPTSSGMVWVQGIEGAKAHPVGSGNSVLLMDSEEMVFYIKSTDPNGIPQPLRIYEYKERTATQPSVDFVTHDELEKRLSQLEKPKTKKTKKEDDDE